MRPDGEPKGYRIGNRIDATKKSVVDRGSETRNQEIKIHS